MSRRKLPPEAFSYYVSLGTARSYTQVAEHFSVTKRAVVNLAARERWQAQLDEIERQAREKAKSKATESQQEMDERHLKIARAMQSKALDALLRYPLETALQAVKALESSVRQERAIRCEPAGETTASVESIIRREYERWMLPAESAPGSAPTSVENPGTLDDEKDPR